MKYFIIFGLVLSLFGCGSDNNSNNQNQAPSNIEELDFQSLDLTGTWLMVTEERKTKIETGEYLSSQFLVSTYVFEDTDRGVKHDQCGDYGDFYSSYGIKTAEHFYMFPDDPMDTGFTIQDKNTLEKITTYEAEWAPGFSFVSIETLTKISDDVDIDNGTFILNGPISIAEYNHTCIWRSFSNVGESKTLEFSAPYDNDSVSFGFRFAGEVAAGSYYYNNYWESEEVFLDVYSSADAFLSTVGSNTLGAEDVTINIIESTNEKLAGTFSLLGQDNEVYTGEFEVFIRN